MPATHKSSAPPATSTPPVPPARARRVSAGPPAPTPRPTSVGRIPVLDVRPQVQHGRRPAKAVVGEAFEVSATVFREGHDAVAANVVLTGPDGTLAVQIAGGSSYATSRLGDVETLHAMTVHKSQGSQAREISVLLPPADSPLLTRELFYTAVTRAQEKVTVIGTREAVIAAVRQRAQRATGLRHRLLT